MEEPKLECSQCGERYARGEHCPRSLFCGHVFCTSCLDRVITAGSPKCPECDRPFISFSAAQLPTEFTLLKRATTTSKGSGNLTFLSGTTLDAPSYQSPNSRSSSAYRFKSLDAITSSAYLSKPLSSSISSSYLSKPLVPSSSNLSKTISSTSSSSNLSTTATSTPFHSKLSKPTDNASPPSIQTTSARTTTSSVTPEVKISGRQGLQLPLIGSTSPTYTSLSPTPTSSPSFSALPSYSRIKSFPSSQATSSLSEKSTDVVDSPHSAHYPKSRSENLNKREAKSTFNFTLPTIRTQLNIHNQEDTPNSVSTESSNTYSESAEASVSSSHVQPMDKRSLLNTSTPTVTSSSSPRASEEYSSIYSNTSHVTSDSSHLAKLPTTLNSKEKQTPVESKSSDNISATSHTDLPTSSSILSSTSHSSATSHWTLPSLSKFNTKLSSSASKVSNTVAPVDEVDQGISSWKIDISSLGLKNRDTEGIRSKGAASKTPDHVLKMVRSITKARNVPSSKVETSVNSTTDHSLLDDLKEIPVSHLPSEERSEDTLSGYYQSNSKSNSISSLTADLTSATDIYRKESIKQNRQPTDEISSTTWSKLKITPHQNSSIPDGSLRKTRDTIVSHTKSDTDVFKHEDIKYPTDRSVTMNDSNGKHSTLSTDNTDYTSMTSGEYSKSVSSLGGTNMERTLLIPEMERQKVLQKSERTLTHSQSVESETPDGEPEIRARSSEIKLARSSSLSARLKARTSFIADAIDEDKETESHTEKVQSTEKRYNEYTKAVAKADKNADLTIRPVSLSARISSRTSFIPRTSSLDGGDDVDSGPQPPKQSQNYADETTSKTDPDMKLIRRSWMKMQRSKNRDLLQESVQPYSTINSVPSKSEREAEKQHDSTSQQFEKNKQSIDKPLETKTKDSEVRTEGDDSDTPPSLPSAPPPTDDSVETNKARQEPQLHQYSHNEKNITDSIVDTNMDFKEKKEKIQETNSKFVSSGAANDLRKHGMYELPSSAAKYSSRQHSQRNVIASQSEDSDAQESKETVTDDSSHSQRQRRYQSRNLRSLDKESETKTHTASKSSLSITQRSQSFPSSDYQSSDKQTYLRKLPKTSLQEDSFQSKSHTVNKSSSSGSWMSRSSLSSKHRRASLDSKSMSHNETVKFQPMKSNKKSNDSSQTNKMHGHRTKGGYKSSSDSEWESKSSGKIGKSPYSRSSMFSDKDKRDSFHGLQKTADTENNAGYHIYKADTTTMLGKPSSTNRQGVTKYHSRITDIDQLLDLHVGDVPSVQDESSGASEDPMTDNEEEQTSSKAALTTPAQETTNRHCQDTKKKTEAEQKYHAYTSRYSKSTETIDTDSKPTRKIDEDKVTQNPKETTSNNLHKSDYGASQSRHRAMVSGREARQTTEDVVDSPKENKMSCDKSEDAVSSTVNKNPQELWHDKNSKIREYLANRPIRSHDTSDKIPAQTEENDPVAQLRRARYSLRNTVNTEPPHRDQKSDSSSQRLLSHQNDTEDVTTQKSETVTSTHHEQWLDKTITHNDGTNNEKVQNLSSHPITQVFPTPQSTQTVNITTGTKFNTKTSKYQEEHQGHSEVNIDQVETTKMYSTLHDDTLVSTMSVGLRNCDTSGSAIYQEDTSSYLIHEDQAEDVNVAANFHTLQSEQLMLANSRQDLGLTFQQLTEAWSTAYMDPVAESLEERPETYFPVQEVDGPASFANVTGAPPGVGLCSRHGLLVHLYCQVCQEWVCNRCVDTMHRGPPFNACQVIPAIDTIVHMKMAHTEFLSSRVDMLDYFREELRKLLVECDNSIREHQARMSQLNLKLKEEVTMLKGIRSMKGLVLQKWQQIDRWDELLRQNAARIHQSSSSQEVLTAVQVNKQNILSNIMEGITPPPASNVDFSLPPDVLY